MNNQANLKNDLTKAALRTSELNRFIRFKPNQVLIPLKEIQTLKLLAAEIAAQLENIEAAISLGGRP